MKKSKQQPEPINEAARALALRSVAARKKKWGVQEFNKRMRAWGKLGGRPRKKTTNRKGTK